MLRDQKAMRWGGDRHPDACLVRKEAAQPVVDEVGE
jgi:hypothetical protein